MAGLRVCLFLLFSLVFVLFGFCDAAKPTIEEKLKEDSDLSEFYALLERNTVANSTLLYRQVTIFAPTNEAFQKRKGESFDDSIVHYHMTNLAMSLSDLQMQYSVNSELEGNPPLWITSRADRMHNDLFVNNARILPDRSYHSTNRIGKRQILHVIDEVLVPVLPSSTASISTMIYNPNAYQFLERSEDLAIGTHRLRSFRQKVNQSKKQDVFRVEGRHTFFIPVEEGFKPTPRPELIDAKVIDGHVIPNHVLFTHATQDDIPFETLTFGDNLKVTVSFTTTHDGKESQTYVKSNTVLGDSKHSMGVVLADIVKANIPVKNGVVHLIQRPLMVVDTTVTQFLEGIDKVDGPLFKFHEVMSDLAYDFLENLKRMKDVTLFAPSNEAWKDKRLSNIISNKQRLHEILHLHLVRERLPMEKIIQNNMHQIYQVPSAAERKYLYFNVIQNGNNQTLTVEAGGVNATVIQPNIAATNGIVHIINRVLGVPYTTVYEKLNTDPMLNDTHFLGRRLSFNQQLTDTTHRYTYLVPRDRAWQKFETEHPTAHKKIFMEDFKYHTRQILERHLVVADRAYTMADMKLHANETHPIVLPSVRDTLRLRVKETDKNYYIEWQNLWIHVFRPDVECTNGIIHVIDYPLITASDITVTGSTSNSMPNILITILLPTILFNVFSIWVIQH